jgi:predicted PurR-regulated permease PerM
MDLYRERVSTKPFMITCISSAVCIVFLLAFIIFRLNTVVGNVNDTLNQSQYLLTLVNQTNTHFDQLIMSMQETLPNVNSFLTSADVMLPHVDSLVLQINSSLPIYTNAVAKLNLTEIQDDISQIAGLIANLTVLANRVAHFFHI